jgi:ubiquinone/menaquinone biosynthesis C-methylase UbiE
MSSSFFALGAAEVSLEDDAMTDTERGQINFNAAEVYEEFFVPALFAQWTPIMLETAALEPGHRVLDVGCGTGVTIRAAADRVRSSGVAVGVDCNEGMLAVARRATERVTWRREVAEALPFDDASFDRVLSQFALMFFDDRRRALEEMARVLAPGGRIVLATWAAIDESPGYAAMVALLRRLFGEPIANVLLAPFCLGDASSVKGLIEPVFNDVRVSRHDGVARFESIDAWVHTDIRGWTLADMIDDNDYELLLAEARVALGEFVQADGRVSFPAPALIASAQRCRSGQGTPLARKM